MDKEKAVDPLNFDLNGFSKRATGDLILSIGEGKFPAEVRNVCRDLALQLDEVWRKKLAADTTHLTRDERTLLAKALMTYKSDLKKETAQLDLDHELGEYNAIEVARTDEVAAKLELDGDYYTPERK
jgi:hypothetical protein